MNWYSLLMDSIGWIGNTALALCALPLAIQAIKTTKRLDLNIPFMLLWTIGEAFTLVYSFSIGKAPLVLNYIVNLSCLAIVWLAWIARKDEDTKNK